MSLRMNLRGWSLAAFKQTIGSRDEQILESAAAHLSKSLTEPHLGRGLAWLRTLIRVGCPLRQDGPPLVLPEDGSLLTLRHETEAHVFVVHAIMQAIATPESLDLSVKSSGYSHPAISAFSKEVGALKMKVPREYWGWLWRFNRGSALFGDDFRTDWSFYSIFDNAELPAMTKLFRDAADYVRVLPETYSEEMRKQIKTTLPPEGKKFALDMANWFEQIHQAGQDAFLFWW